MNKKLVYVAVLLSAIPMAVSAYVVQKGDTLTKIASQTGYSVDSLVVKNNISNKDLIYTGQTLEMPDAVLGASTGYTPVTGYDSRTTQYVNSSATTIPVASTKDPSGNQISLSNISSAATVKVYFNLEPGTTREEGIVCTGVTVSSWTNCTRGLAFQGGSETGSSTLAFAHNAGSKIILTNINQFYNQYVSVDGTQTVNDIKTFTAFPKFSVTTTVPTLGAQFATKYYVDNVGAGGFTSANVSTTRGLSVDGSVPERVGINASSTGGVAFDGSGALYFSGTVNTSTRFNASSTFASTLSVQTPSLSAHAATKLYVDQRFFGDGTDGATTTVGTATLENTKVYQYSSFNVATGTTLTISNTSPLRIKVQGNCDIGGTINLQGKGSSGGTGVVGGVGNNGSAGTGMFGFGAGGGGGEGKINDAATGATGTSATGVTGGAGGTGTTGPDGGSGGSDTVVFNYPLFIDYLKSGVYPLSTGAGGGAGGGQSVAPATAGANGGAGGGSLLLECGGNLFIGGTITVAGSNGSNGANNGFSNGNTGGGGGGGGGTFIGIYGTSYNLTGTITVSGGSGGSGVFGIGGASGGGGAGSAGTSTVVSVLSL